MAKVNADPQTGEGTVWFDYFVVTSSTTNLSSTSFPTSTSTTSASSPTNSSSAMSLIYIDDQDFTNVTYKGSWIRGGTFGEYNNTVSSSTVVGDSFTVSFQGESVGDQALGYRSFCVKVTQLPFMAR